MAIADWRRDVKEKGGCRMIHEWRRYRLKAGMAQPYFQLLIETGLPLVTRHLPLMGYWLAESGELNVIHHLWSYEDWAAREAARAGLSTEKDWTQGFIPKAFAMVDAQENCFLKLTSSSDDFDAALAQRRRSDGVTCREDSIFAPLCAGLVEGDVPEDAVAIFTPLSGAGPARALLARSSDPLALGNHNGRHTVLRPLAFSPL